MAIICHVETGIKAR